ncbi:MAG TPA: NifU N-terminal domain-containing protein [Longimicrobiales bacterium]|nr:NifU N-terminal domain-containing protein [Longimicrobiales bacterium]
MSPVNVRAQPTPNPNALKFILDRRVIEGSGSRSYQNAAGAAGDPVASPLFELPDVAGVFLADDFVTVIKGADASWDALKPEVVAVLQKVFS